MHTTLDRRRRCLGQALAQAQDRYRQLRLELTTSTTHLRKQFSQKHLSRLRSMVDCNSALESTFSSYSIINRTKLGGLDWLNWTLSISQHDITFCFDCLSSVLDITSLLSCFQGSEWPLRFFSPLFGVRGAKFLFNRFTVYTLSSSISTQEDSTRRKR